MGYRSRAERRAAAEKYKAKHAKTTETRNRRTAGWCRCDWCVRPFEQHHRTVSANHDTRDQLKEARHA